MMAKISKAKKKDIIAAVKREFPHDPALQQVHIARKILSLEAKLEGLTYLEYVRKIATRKGRAK
jgi:hypothetical protein